MKLKILFDLNLKKNVLFSALLLLNILGNAQTFEVKQVRFIWTDNDLKPGKSEKIYLISKSKHLTDTIFPKFWRPENNDTVIFEPKRFSNPLHIELESNNTMKRSNKFNLLPGLVYTITEKTDTIIVKAKPQVFDTMDGNFKLLYSFLIKLVIELLIAILVSSLIRLPYRLIFFVFVANIMSFPLQYAYFLSPELKELAGIVLEGIFIYAIGWKRLKLHKALLVSVIINVLRFGIAKIFLMIFKYL